MILNIEELDDFVDSINRIESKLDELILSNKPTDEPNTAPIDTPKKIPVDAPITTKSITRLTDYVNQPPVGFARNDYSRRQAFNSDDSLVLIYAKNGYWHLYNSVGGYYKILSLGGGSVEPQWHPTNPDVLYKFPNNGGLSILSHNVHTDEVAEVCDLSGVKDIWPTAARCWTKSEGSPSSDFKYWGLQVETSDFKPLGLIVVDIDQGIISSFDYKEHGIGRPDHVSMSPSGEYIVPSWHVPNECKSTTELGTKDSPCGLMVYSRDFSYGIGIARKGPHSDICINSDGDDCIVYTDYDIGFVTSFNLNTHERINLFSLYENGASTAFHISGKAFNSHGKVLISTYGGKNGDRWWTDAIFSCTVEENPIITKLADTNNTGSGYWAEPHASVNRDFTKAVFNSNMDSGLEVDCYLLEIERK